MKLFNKKSVILLLVLSLLLSLSGCGNKKEQGTNDLNVHIGGNLKTIDPTICTDSDGMSFIIQCFERQVK